MSITLRDYNHSNNFKTIRSIIKYLILSFNFRDDLMIFKELIMQWLFISSVEFRIRHHLPKKENTQQRY